jgi:urocanate hydratase
MTKFKNLVSKGIPSELPAFKKIANNLSHAPKRRDILSNTEKILALKNALRYFPKKHHSILGTEFLRRIK